MRVRNFISVEQLRTKESAFGEIEKTWRSERIVSLSKTPIYIRHALVVLTVKYFASTLTLISKYDRSGITAEELVQSTREPRYPPLRNGVFQGCKFYPLSYARCDVLPPAFLASFHVIKPEIRPASVHVKKLEEKIPSEIRPAKTPAFTRRRTSSSNDGVLRRAATAAASVMASAVGVRTAHPTPPTCGHRRGVLP